MAVRAQLLIFRENEKTTPDFFDEKSKTSLGFEIGQPQQNCQYTPTLQSLANLAVVKICNFLATLTSIIYQLRL